MHRSRPLSGLLPLLLQLDANPITLDILRAISGFEAFDARRRARADKQLEAGAMFDVNRAFSEGADQRLFQRWHRDKQL